MIAQQKVSDDEFLVVSLRLLSRLTGKHEHTWSKWLNGQQSPNTGNIREVAIALDMEPMRLWGLIERRRQINQRLVELERSVSTNG